LPSVDRLLSHYAERGVPELPHTVLTALARELIATARAAIDLAGGAPDLDQLATRLEEAVRSLARPALRPVINATGVIIHTNLGRAPLSTDARVQMDLVGRGYSNLEFDIAAGRRGSRHEHLSHLLSQVTGAEDGIAVNNNASALLLVLSCLTAGREVVISRSQAVEIGGGFRIPDIMRQSGSTLVEVGTTNRTYLSDFEDAAGSQTAAFLRVHASNFRIRGFTCFPELVDLTAAAHRRDLLVLDDLGSGCLLPVEPFGLAHEPLVQESVTAGADLSLFSGDKLLGGPQAGIIVGRRDLLRQLRAHPLARALRMDKTSIAGLAATLLHYLRGEALDKIPVWQMIAASEIDIRERAQRLALHLGGSAGFVSTRTMVGGGSLPDESLPSAAVRIDDPGSRLAKNLRQQNPPVIVRAERGSVLLDLRTVDPADDTILLVAARAAITPG